MVKPKKRCGSCKEGRRIIIFGIPHIYCNPKKKFHSSDFGCNLEEVILK